MDKIVVIGAGQAGSSLVAQLRKLGFTGSLTLIGEEPALPYERPPLSKGYLLGDLGQERLYLRPASFYSDNDITLLTGTPVAGIDRAARTVTAAGRQIPYDALALCTGSVPRHLPGAIGGALGGVHVVRTLADVDRMAPEVRSGARALVIGGGYIGLEAAAVAAKSGMQVTVIEMADRILQRVAAPETSDYFRQLHRDHGVDIREGVGLTRLTGDSHVTGAILSDGTDLPADLVIVGIGIAPATALAEAAGLEIENGIKTDAHGRTSDPAIWAAGDCASFPYKGGRIRLESVQNAIDQADCVAENMLGADKEYDPHPWFWSDQYDCKLQIAGLSTGYDRIVTRGEGASVSFWYFNGDRFLAVDAMNDARSYMVGKRLLEMGKSPDPAALADPATDLKALVESLMRIIAGAFKGLRLASVGKGDAAAHLRPTADRVRESLFNVLSGGHFGDPIPDARVLDLCAGTGALGLEALSRGAAHVTFVDDGTKAGALIRENIGLTRTQSLTRLFRRDATRLGPVQNAPFSLVFLDPPYGKGLGARILSSAAAGGWLAPGALIVLEENTPQSAPPGFAVLDSRRYGHTHVTFLRFDDVQVKQ